MNAAESGADELIRDLIAEVESLRSQLLDQIAGILGKVQENNKIVKDAEARLDRAGL